MLRGHSPLTYAIERGSPASPGANRRGRQGTRWLGDPPAAELVDEPLRLLHIVPTYLPALRYGGPIRSVHALCRALAADGHDVHVFTTNVDGSDDSDVPLARPVDLEGVKVTYFPSRRLRRLYWSPPMRRALAASVGGFDVVHLHAVYLWPIWAGARAARAAGRALHHLAARYARARADAPQEPVGEGGLDRTDRAHEPGGGRRHPYDVVGRGGPSFRLRLEAAADRHHCARRRRSAATFRRGAVGRHRRRDSAGAARAWRSAASAGRRGSIG